MKMMSRTRTTSTSGVTLMPLMSSSSSSPPENPAIRSRLPAGARLEVRDRRVPERRCTLRRPAQAPLEQVVGDDRGERHEQPDGGGDERLADADHDRPRAGGARVAREVEEGADDAEHRAEQPYERGVVPERAEEGEPQLVVDARPLDR